MSIGQNIRKYRKSISMTQEELANKVNAIQSNVYRWEKDLVTPSIETIKKISKALNVSVDGLLFTNGERQKLRISDKELLERIKDIESLNDNDRQAIITLIDAVKAKSNS